MFNQFSGIGNLAADVASQFTQGGKRVANFTVCCDNGYGDNKKTEFVRCVAWEKIAGVCADYLTKGSKVFIQGPMQTRKWQDKDGNDKYTVEIVVREMKMLGGGQARQDNDHGKPESTMGQDVPF